jgi:hypothetical protein
MSVYAPERSLVTEDMPITNDSNVVFIARHYAVGEPVFQLFVLD